MYYLLDNTGFEPSVFTTRIAGINVDPSTMLTVWGANCDLATLGAVRVALEPKPGLPSDPDDPRAFIDIFTDIRGLFVINNESGWYEGWMIHDLRVADVASPDAMGHAPFGMITHADAVQLAAMGSGNNVPGHFFTVDGLPPHVPSPSDHFPDRVTNVVPLHLSMGAYNYLQQSDCHAYWGVQLHDELDPSALRAPLHRRLPGPVAHPARRYLRGRGDRRAAVNRARRRARGQ